MKERKFSTYQIVFVAVMAALVCVVTFFRFPLLGSKVHFANAMCLLSGMLFGPMLGGLAAGLGSGLADLISGYGVYVPATFIIKGVMAIAAYFGFRFLQNKVTNISARIVSGIVAELIMVFGYYVFEGFLYGFGASLVNIPANAVQGVAGLIIGTILVKIFEKSKIIKTEV